jgi:hypothetical protein
MTDRPPKSALLLHDIADGGHFGASIEPVQAVDLGDRIYLDGLDGQRPAELDEPVDVPGVEPIVRRPEVVLLPYREQY